MTTSQTPLFLSSDPFLNQSVEQTPPPRAAKRVSFGHDFTSSEKEVTPSELTGIFLELFPEACQHFPSDFPFTGRLEASSSNISNQWPNHSNDPCGFLPDDFFIAQPSPPHSISADLSTSPLFDDTPSDTHQPTSSSYTATPTDSPADLSKLSKSSAKRSLVEFLAHPSKALIAASSSPTDETSLAEEIHSMAIASSARNIKRLGTKKVLMRYYGLYLIFKQKLPKTKPSAISSEAWKTLQIKKINLISSITIGDHEVTVRLSTHFDRTLFHFLIEANKARPEDELISFYDDFSAIFAIKSEMRNGTTERTIRLPAKAIALFPQTATKKQASDLIASFFYKLIVNTCIDDPAACLKKQGLIRLHHHLKGFKADEMIEKVVVNTIEEMSSSI